MSTNDYVSKIGSKIVLIDGSRLTELMIEFGVAVATEATYTVKRIDNDFFEFDIVRFGPYQQGTFHRIDGCEKRLLAHQGQFGCRSSGSDAFKDQTRQRSTWSDGGGVWVVRATTERNLRCDIPIAIAYRGPGF